MINELIQTLALCIGHSASPLLLVDPEEVHVLEDCGSCCHEEEPLRNTLDGVETVMHPHASYFQSQSTNQSISNSDIGNYYLLLFLSYLDFFKTDSVVSESQDWVVSTGITPITPYLQSPLLFLSQYSTSMMSWIASYASSQNISYSVPQGWPSYTYEYYYYFLSSYLDSAGFIQTSSSLQGDFELAFCRSNLWILGEPMTGSIYVDDTGLGAAVNAVNNGWLSVFNLSLAPSGLSVNDPFIVVGYKHYEFPETYSLIGFNPRIGTLEIGSNYIYEVTVLNFHPDHSHSNNLQTNSPSFSYCGCGYKECLGAHSFGSATPSGTLKHRYSCGNCDYSYQENHVFYYEWKTALKHRKYCPTCGWSVLENHHGTYCICMLGN